MEVVQLLIDAGAGALLLLDNGGTALHVTSSYGNKQVVQMLLEPAELL